MSTIRHPDAQIFHARESQIIHALCAHPTFIKLDKVNETWKNAGVNHRPNYMRTQTAESRVTRLTSMPLDKYGETRHVLHQLDIKGLFAWPSVIKDGFINGREYDHNTRQFRCEELRAKRAAKRLMAELGMGPTRINSDYSPTGREFCSYAELIHVDAIYCYAIVKSSHSIDC